MDDTQLSEHYEQEEAYNIAVSDLAVLAELETIMDAQQ